MSYLRVENLTLSLDSAREEDERALLCHLSLDIEEKEIVGILGPSGAGKSLLLRALIGLEKPTEGEIFLEGMALSSLSPSERSMAYLSQRLVLYPHLSGGKNAGFFYWIRGLLKKDKDIRFHPVISEVLEHLHLMSSDLLGRLPKTMAGGEKQRIALARAIASEAKILLLDEPFANIEDIFRDTLRHFLRKWIQKRGQTALIVSHNQEEMASLCDRLVLLDRGSLIQQGTYEDLSFSPTSRITALFMGVSRKNFLSSELLQKLWGKTLACDVVLLPSLVRQEPLDEWDVEIKGPIIMVEHFFREKKKLLCIEYKNELFFWEVDENLPFTKGDRVTLYLPLKEGWFFEKDYPYRRIYQGVMP
ncbi:MAG: ABC transporter ATP-binding protein [Brevinematales bacterium]|nr:ABC transporter ATP-binding protein [Brevinematales bacterium]